MLRKIIVIINLVKYYIFGYKFFIFVCMLFCLLCFGSFKHALISLAYILTIVVPVYMIYKFIKDIYIYGFSEKHLQIIEVVLLLLFGLIALMQTNIMSVSYGYRVVTIVAKRGYLIPCKIWFKNLTELMIIRSRVKASLVKNHSFKENFLRLVRTVIPNPNKNFLELKYELIFNFDAYIIKPIKSIKWFFNVYFFSLTLP